MYLDERSFQTKMASLRLGSFYLTELNLPTPSGQLLFGGVNTVFQGFHRSDFKVFRPDLRDFKDFKYFNGLRPYFKEFKSGIRDFKDFKSGIIDFGTDFWDFRSDLKGFRPYSRDRTFNFKVSGILRRNFNVFKSDFREFWSDFTNFRDLRDFRLDFRDFRSDFRTFVHRISEVAGPNPPYSYLLFPYRQPNLPFLNVTIVVRLRSEVSQGK